MTASYVSSKTEVLQMQSRNEICMSCSATCITDDILKHKSLLLLVDFFHNEHAFLNYGKYLCIGHLTETAASFKSSSQEFYFALKKISIMEI